jgi:hypothetical protein
MTDTILKAAVVFAFAGGFLSVFFILYYFYTMLANVRPEKRNRMQLLGPFSFLLPNLWNDKGNSARIKLLISMFLFALFFLFIQFAVKT